jgi:hypothetical protein
MNAQTLTMSRKFSTDNNFSKSQFDFDDASIVKMYLSQFSVYAERQRYAGKLNEILTYDDVATAAVKPSTSGTMY